MRHQGKKATLLTNREALSLCPKSQECGWTGSVPPAVAGGTDLFQAQVRTFEAMPWRRWDMQMCDYAEGKSD